MPISPDKWFEGVNYEVGFWQNYLNAKGGVRWSDDFRNRFDPNRPFNSMVEEAIRDTGSREIELLDVGSGPVTSLGYVSKRFDIRITAVDPLADAYSVLLDEAGVMPPVKTQNCFGENLLQHFGSRRFHVCHSCNALDHSLDPRNILFAMAQLLRPHGLMFVRVHKNEGESTGYSGLHNWNFDTDENRNFILWRGSEKYKINEDLSDFVDGRAAEMHVDDDPEIVFIGYRKAV
jgi:SAM-dependent methyltransferase